MRQQPALWLQFGAFLAIWIALILMKGYELSIDSRALSLFPSTIGIYAVLYFAFVKWGWRWSIFRNWLVVIPDIQGTWRGELQTTWTDPETGLTPQPIEFFLTIRQSLYYVHVKIYTRESESHSESAALHVDEVTGTTTLSYSYSNIPDSRVRHRSEIHFGAARLSLARNPVLALTGDYWTDRKTTGHMRVTYIGKESIESFPSVTPDS